MREDRDRIAANIDEDLKAWADREDRSLREIIETGIELQRGDERRELDKEIEKEKSEFEEMQDDFEDLRERMEKKAEEIEKLEGRKEEIEEEKQDYTDWLDDLLDRRENGEDAFLVKDVIMANDKFGDYREGAEKIQQDLIDRAIYQKRELCESDFSGGTGVRVGEKPLYKQADEDEESDGDGEATDQEGGSYGVSYSGGTADD